MLLQVGYEGSEVIPQNRVLPTSVSATPPRSGVEAQTQNSICKHFWNLSSSSIHSSLVPASTPGL